MLKGIILAGGTGSRLNPITNVISKQLINVYDKPLIYYPISTLMLSGIKNILIITNKSSQSQFKNFLGNGSNWGITLKYAVQDKPAGLPQAFIIAKKFIKNDKVCLILGDNILYGSDIGSFLKKAFDDKDGATIFTYSVNNPEEFGVVEFKNKKIISIKEKPKRTKSNNVIIGIYFFDKNVSWYAKKLNPSKRGELEITDLIRKYQNLDKLRFVELGRGFTWMDVGNFNSVLTASNHIANIEKIQDYKIGCPEEIAFRNKWINKQQLLKLSQNMKNSTYGKYLKKISKIIIE